MPRARRGLTFLEVVLASVILASVVSVVMTAINYIYGQSERQLARLGAMELGNRLMMIFLDDENEFKRQPMALDFDGRRYKWTWHEANVAVLPVIEGESAKAIKSAERLRNVQIDVWLASESGGSEALEGGVPSARVVRLVDVIYMNPDSVQNAMSSDEGQRALIDRVRRTRSTATPPRTGAGSGGGLRTPTQNPGTGKPRTGGGR
jgi:hypothetical protein